jgi:hypothetical protein
MTDTNGTSPGGTGRTDVLAPGTGPRGLRALGPGQTVVAVGCLLTLISLFLTWMGVTLTYVNCSYCLAPNGNKDGFAGIGILAALVLLGTIAFLVARSPMFRNVVSVTEVGGRDGRVYLASGVILLVCMVIYYPEFHNVSTGGQRSPEAGFYLAILGALLIAIGGAITLARPSAPRPVGAAHWAAPGSAGPGGDVYTVGAAGTPGSQGGNDRYTAPGATDPYAPPPDPDTGSGPAVHEPG